MDRPSVSSPETISPESSAQKFSRTVVTDNDNTRLIIISKSRKVYEIISARLIPRIVFLSFFSLLILFFLFFFFLSVPCCRPAFGISRCRHGVIVAPPNRKARTTIRTAAAAASTHFFRQRTANSGYTLLLYYSPVDRGKRFITILYRCGGCGSQFVTIKTAFCLETEDNVFPFSLFCQPVRVPDNTGI